MPSTHNRPDDPAGRRSKLFQPASSRDLGLLAAVGIAACCALPLLIGAGALAAVGGALGPSAVIAVAAALAVGTVAWVARRRRMGRADCCPPAAARPVGAGHRVGADREEQ